VSQLSPCFMTKEEGASIKAAYAAGNSQARQGTIGQVQGSEQQVLGAVRSLA
jgi:hypothetical protein